MNTGLLASPSSGSALGIGIIPGGAEGAAAPAAPAAGIMPVVAGGGMVGTVFMPGVVVMLGVVGVVGAVVFVGGVDAARPATPVDMLDGFAAPPATLPRPAVLIMLAAGGAAMPAELERAVAPAPDEASLPEHAATDNAHPIIHARARTRSTF